MKETSKSRPGMVERGIFETLLRGNGIDIGAGDDPLVVDHGTVRAWDKADGEASELPGIAPESQDFVYSSHALEHLEDVPKALKRWVEVVRPGGCLYVVVPDYTLYEQHCWPSRHNNDHKQSFSLLFNRFKVGRDNHWGMPEMFRMSVDLGLHLIQSALEDDGFNYDFGPADQTISGAQAQIRFVWIKDF